ncbi:FAD-binding protein [Kitasatospora sp. NPDC049285]|uniref:FAD-binding oxidoreductase n=1 Tax=Kitasatospora sp. NPDC049285 TaxID=3157096 RepID=UPI003428B75F
MDLIALERARVAEGDGEVRFDAGSRGAYATDGSNYRQVPLGVVVPRSVEAGADAVGVCAAFQAPVLARGGGTSLGGQCTLPMPAIRGAYPADDPRTAATLRAVRADLASDHYGYRFRHDQRPLQDAEGAFLLCGFTMALAEHQQHDDVEAARRFERNRAACGPPGVYAEEFDVAQRQPRGNLPQA